MCVKIGVLKISLLDKRSMAILKEHSSLLKFCVV